MYEVLYANVVGVTYLDLPRFSRKAADIILADLPGRLGHSIPRQIGGTKETPEAGMHLSPKILPKRSSQRPRSNYNFDIKCDYV
jgi:hypothetical protein